MTNIQNVIVLSWCFVLYTCSVLYNYVINIHTAINSMNCLNVYIDASSKLDVFYSVPMLPMSVENNEMLLMQN